MCSSEGENSKTVAIFKKRLSDERSLLRIAGDVRSYFDVVDKSQLSCNNTQVIGLCLLLKDCGLLHFRETRPSLTSHFSNEIVLHVWALGKGWNGPDRDSNVSQNSISRYGVVPQVICIFGIHRRALCRHWCADNHAKDCREEQEKSSHHHLA